MRMAIVALALFTGGCVSAYKTTEVTDKFSDPSKPALLSMRGNNIDHTDGLNVLRWDELNGFVARDRATGKNVFVGLSFSGVGRPPMRNTWISIRSGDELVFLADGERIAVQATTGRTDVQISRGLGSIDREYYDLAEYRMTPEQFATIAKAKTLEFKISGMNGSESYPRGGRSFLGSFQPNLLKFYQAEIQSRQ